MVVKSAYSRESPLLRHSPWLVARFVLIFAALISLPAQGILGKAISSSPSPTPPLEVMSGAKTPQTYSPTPTPLKGWEVPHGDIWVFGATLLLAFATLMLVWITRRHVQHTEELVRTAKSIFEIDRVSRLVLSVQNDNDNKAVVHVQNVGRTPVMVNALSLSLVKSQKTSTEQNIIEAQNRWILPLNGCVFKHPELSNVWATAKFDAAILVCNFQDIYYDEATSIESKVKTVRMKCEFDHESQITNCQLA